MLLSPNPLGEVIIPQIHPLSCIVAIIPITTSQGDMADTNRKCGI